MSNDIIIPERLAAEARAEARRKKQAEDRADVVQRITSSLSDLKKAGRIGSMQALAELIVDGQLPGVAVDWDAA